MNDAIAEHICRWYLGLGRIDYAGRQPYISASEPLRPLLKLFPDLLQYTRAKRVIDFGSANGLQSFALAESGAAEVLGVEINPLRVERAADALTSRKLNNVSFVEQLSERHDNQFDIAISMNSFEHFDDADAILAQIHKALRPSGLLFMMFGPLWYSAYGPHQGEFTKSPWPHLFFHERTFMKIRGEMCNQSHKKTYAERGLNRMSVRKYEQTIGRSGFRINRQKYICSSGLGILKRAPVLRELAINRIAVVLEKPVELR